MKKHIITIVATQTLLLSGIFAQDWKFKSGEEDWGETLYATQKSAEGATITIFTAKEEFKPSMLISPYKADYGDAFTVEISVDKGQSYRLKGSNSEYFGEIQVEGIEKKMLQEMMIGTLVSISIANKDTISFNLTGSSKAIGQLGVAAPKIENKQKDNNANAAKPLGVKLNSDKADQSNVTLRWKGDTPSMDMNNTNSGEGWAEGHKESPGVYSFFQSKFYSLTLDFNKGTFVEGGFDGDWLPEVTGTFTPIK
jgi:hypothetical protein